MNLLEAHDGLGPESVVHVPQARGIQGREPAFALDGLQVLLRGRKQPVGIRVGCIEGRNALEDVNGGPPLSRLVQTVGLPNTTPPGRAGVAPHRARPSRHDSLGRAP